MDDLIRVTDVIIRNVGGNQLKVIDVDRVQSSGNIEQKFPIIYALTDVIDPSIKIEQLDFKTSPVNVLICICSNLSG